MKAFTCSNTVKKDIPGNPDVYMDALMKKMHGKLINLKIPSTITNDTLVFERPIQLYHYDRGILFKPTEKGKFELKKSIQVRLKYSGKLSWKQYGLYPSPLYCF